jgi:hypothetical protein
MDTMLDELSAEEISRIVVECFGGNALPQWTDAAARERAAQTARQQGLAEQVEADLADEGPIAVLPYSGFRDYRRTGNRRRFEALQRWRWQQIELAAIACLLGQDKLTYLQDLLWAECEATWWVMPAHEAHGTPIDLRAAMLGCKLAEILTLFRGRIEPEVRRRVLDEVDRRIFRPYLSPACTHGWKTRTNNWNAVCLGGVGIASLLLEPEPQRLASLIADVLAHLPAFLASFADDGGCDEGPSYWRFGFGWYMRLATALFDYTGGRIDIASGERIERISRYPLAAAVAPGCELTFADAHAGYMDYVTAHRINRFHDLPELFGLCELREDGTPVVETMEGLLLYDGKTHRPLADSRDYFLPGLGIAKVKAGPLTAAVKAGHNAENHNHNDVGSFLVFRGATAYLTDPGSPIYSARTFSQRRYESPFCNSFGHSVPAIDGRGQPPGRQFCGTLAPEGLNADAPKAVTVELADAYDADGLERLTRVLDLPAGGTEVRLTDAFAFRQPPESVEEAFITTQPVEVAEDGQSVTIRPETDVPAMLAAVESPGAFALTELVEESRAESRTGETVRRITFAPAEPAEEMTLRFVLRFEPA